MSPIERDEKKSRNACHLAKKVLHLHMLNI